MSCMCGSLYAVSFAYLRACILAFVSVRVCESCIVSTVSWCLSYCARTRVYVRARARVCVCVCVPVCL